LVRHLIEIAMLSFLFVYVVEKILTPLCGIVFYFQTVWRSRWNQRVKHWTVYNIKRSWNRSKRISLFCYTNRKVLSAEFQCSAS
jgi:hypothetical protein